MQDFPIKDVLGIYDVEKVAIKWRVLPDYVKSAHTKRPTKDPNYDKIVVDKWGRKDVSTTLYIETPEMIFFRDAMFVAKQLHERYPERYPNLEETTEYIFNKYVNREIFPNTPHMANAGHDLFANYIQERVSSLEGVKQKTLDGLLMDLEEEKKQKPQLFACFVLGLYDSRESIIRETLADASEIQAHTGGTGFNFSNLRPANEPIKGTGGTTDGPVSFMATYSDVLGTRMNQGGHREGANMFILNYNHPDIMRFIYSKRQDGEIHAANISVGVWHEFFEKVVAENEEDSFYPLVNPHHHPEIRREIPQFYTVDQLRKAENIARISKKTVLSLILGENGRDVLSPHLMEWMDETDRVVGKVGDDGIVYLNAKKVMKHLANSAWFNGEPGIIHLGHINDQNPTHPKYYIEYLREQNQDKTLEELETIVNQKSEDGRFINLPPGIGILEGTNPCGEKPLLPNESCVLGHTNWESVLVNRNGFYEIDWDSLAENTTLMYEILDNAIDDNFFTTKAIEVTQKSNRKIGLGFMGLANMLLKLEIPYNSQKGRDFVEKVWSFQEDLTDRLSREKAEKFGEFPNFKYSKFRKEKPLRNAIRRTLAPTGTTSFVAFTSSGCEPLYALSYTRTTVQGTEISLLNHILEEKLKKYPIFPDGDNTALIEFISDESRGNGSMQGFKIERIEGESEESFKQRQYNLAKLKEIFVTAHDIDPEDHLRMEAVIQRHTDDAISKTTNFRKNATVEDIEKAYILSHQLKIKGTTFYRDGTRKGQPLKVKRDNKQEFRGNLADLVLAHLNRARPTNVGGVTEKVRTPYDYSAFITLNWEKDDKGNPISTYECFVETGKAGQDLPAIAQGYGRLISLALQSGIPAWKITEQLKGIGGETQRVIGEERVKSLPDAIGKGIEIALQKEGKWTENYGESKRKKSGNLCPSCSRQLDMEEGCEKCRCGYSKCN